MKRILALIFLPSLCYSGTFTEKISGVYEFRGSMEASDVQKFKDIASKHAKFELVIDSEGGSLFAGMELAEFTRQIEQKVRITAGECYSAAALWASADPDMRYRDKDSFLAWHLPWYYMRGGPAEQTVGMTTKAAYWMTTCMNRTLGEPKAKDLILWMSDVRDLHGINGFVVQMRGKADRSALWDDGWKFDGETVTLRPNLSPAHWK